jgi:hypothetical protein
MILLTATTESLELVTGSALSTDWTVAYADHTTTAFTPGSGQGNVATAATTSIVAAPAASTQRQVKLITVRNRDGTGSQVVSIQKNPTGTAIRLTPDVTLLPGEVLEYLDGQGFRVLDPFAQLKGTSGNVTVTNIGTITSPNFTQDQDVRKLLGMLITEQRIMNMLLASAFTQKIDLDALRSDASMTVQ